MRDYAEAKAQRYSGITKAAIMFCTAQENQEGIFQELESLLLMKGDELDGQPFQLLKDMKLVWSGRESLFVKLLMLKNLKLVSALMGGSVPPGIKGFGKLEIENTDWWLEWLEELEIDDTDGRHEWLLWQIAGFLTEYMDEDSRIRFIERLNDKKSGYRKVLLKYIMPRLEICLDDLNEDTIGMLPVRSMGEGIFYKEDICIKIFMTKQYDVI